MKKRRAPKPAARARTATEIATAQYFLHVLSLTDVAFKLAAASLEKGQMPEVATVRSGSSSMP